MIGTKLYKKRKNSCDRNRPVHTPLSPMMFLILYIQIREKHQEFNKIIEWFFFFLNKEKALLVLGWDPVWYISAQGWQEARNVLPLFWTVVVVTINLIDWISLVLCYCHNLHEILVTDALNLVGLCIRRSSDCWPMHKTA